MEHTQDIEDELRATEMELNGYREAGYIDSFQQHWLY
tara:strand:+ start:808 stop:918 length:111 start_codon:yes stop_codon:yes gene_type:complete